MRFENWLITEDGIEWNGDGDEKFFIPKEEITRTTIGTSGIVYEWIKTATEQTWISEDDLYDLNFAFVYAASAFNCSFSYDTFDNTLDDQYEQFESEDDEDCIS